MKHLAAGALALCACGGSAPPPVEPAPVVVAASPTPSSGTEPTAGPTPDAPEAVATHETPSRQEVVAAFQGAEPAVAACGGPAGSVATVTVIFESDGSAREARVSGVPDPAVAECVRLETLRIRLPPFTREEFRVSFPLHL